MKLFLEEIWIKNWGPFFKESILEFSLNENTNITYIVGRNSTGKTCIFDAIYWSLFNIPGVDNLKSFINKVALKSGENQMYVRLKFHVFDKYDNRTDYDIKRSVRYDIIETKEHGSMPDMLQFDFYAVKYNQTSSRPEPVSEKEFQKLMDNYIPPGPRPFFFLDGERLTELFTRERSQMIESYVNALSDMGLIERMINKLNNTYESFSDQLSRVKKANEKIAAEQKKLRDEEERQKVCIEEEENLSTQLEQHTELEETLREQCNKYEELKPRLDETKSLERRINEKENLYSVEYGRFTSLLRSNLFILYLEEQMRWCHQDLSKLKKEGKIPTSKIPTSLIEEILNIKKECICGRDLDEAMKIKFNQLLETLPSQDQLNDSVNIFWDKLGENLEKAKRAREKIKMKLLEIRKINLEINRLKNELNEEKKYIPIGEDFEEIGKKYRRWVEVKERIGNLQNDLDGARNALALQTAEINRRRKKLESKLESDVEMEKIGRKLRFTRETKETAEYAQERVKETIAAYIQTQASDVFRQLIWDPTNWEGISIRKDWKFTAITSDGYRLPCHSLSAGQRHVLGIAFMSSLGKVTGNLIPFIFDSPFGRISEDPIEKIGKNLRTLMENRQVILFVTDTEDKNIRPHIEKIIGQKYILDKISGTESEIRGV